MEKLTTLSINKIPVEKIVSGEAFRDINYPKEILDAAKKSITFERIIKENLMRESTNPLVFYEALNNINIVYPWLFINSSIREEIAGLQIYPLKTDEIFKLIRSKLKLNNNETKNIIVSAIRNITNFVLLIYNNEGNFMGNNGIDIDKYVDFDPAYFCWEKNEDNNYYTYFSSISNILDFTLKKEKTFDNVIDSIVSYFYKNQPIGIGSIDLMQFEIYKPTIIPREIIEGYNAINDKFQYSDLGNQMKEFYDELEEELLVKKSILYFDNYINFGGNFINKEYEARNMGSNIIFYKKLEENIQEQEHVGDLIKNKSIYIIPNNIALNLISTTFAFNTPESYQFYE